VALRLKSLERVNRVQAESLEGTAVVLLVVVVVADDAQFTDLGLGDWELGHAAARDVDAEDASLAHSYEITPVTKLLWRPHRLKTAKPYIRKQDSP
jgi:hypothetical protein